MVDGAEWVRVVVAGPASCLGVLVGGPGSWLGVLVAGPGSWRGVLLAGPASWLGVLVAGPGSWMGASVAALAVVHLATSTQVTLQTPVVVWVLAVNECAEALVHLLSLSWACLVLIVVVPWKRMALPCLLGGPAKILT